MHFFCCQVYIPNLITWLYQQTHLIYLYILVLQRCIIKGLLHFLLKQVNRGKCINEIKGSLRCINHSLPKLVPIFVYNDSHLSLNQQ